VVHRTLLAFLLALQFAAVANVSVSVAKAEIPFPQCWPCPDDVR